MKRNACIPRSILALNTPSTTPQLLKQFHCSTIIIVIILFVSQEDERNDTAAETRMQDILTRRKLVDLAKAQAQEIAVLRAEVERLRMRTFPALVQVDQR